VEPFEQSEEKLFVKWLELPPEKRKEFIDTLCLDDPVMLESVLELIRGYENSEGLFEVSPEEDFSAVAAEVQSIAPSDESAGDLIGRYRLVEKIGEGAWGSVWLARQTEDIDRVVALKILKLGLDTKEFLRRFEAERQMLAMMEHPSIATIHDAGSTDFGRPYLVMELVRGKPLLEYANEKRMTLEQRVELYIRICKALEHAHEKGVIHRDIKPSNILVAEQDDGPVPKVIDFGVAKSSGSQLGGKTLHTNIHTFTGTPLYSSPEQLEFSGEVVDNRSDVYSLGALLYEFLTGAPPFGHDKLSGAGLEGIRKIVRETDPPVPSRRLANLEPEEQDFVAARRVTQASKLESQLKGDLDWIIMKCLEKDRERRYESAQALGEDLRGFLDCRPVSAAAPSTLYRAGKFIRRNRLNPVSWVGVTVLLCALVYVFLVPKPSSNPLSAISLFSIPHSENNLSIAVLPFDSFSANEHDAFIAAGLHGELTTSLARIRDLKTIARESTMRYRDTDKPLATIGQDLGVTTVVTGDVQRLGKNMRVNVQLIDVVDNRTLWGDSYTREYNPSKVFEIQSEICAAIVDELGSLLSLETDVSRSTVPTQNMEALAAYFKANEIYSFLDMTRFPEAIELYEKAIELDPEFAQAHEALAGALFTSGVFFLHGGAAGYRALDTSREEAVEKSKEMKKRAFEVAAKGWELDNSLLGLQVPFVFNSMHNAGGGGLELDDSLLDLQIPFIFNGTVQENTEFSRAFWERYIEEQPNSPIGYMGMGYWYGNIHLTQFTQESRTPDNPDWMAMLEKTYSMWKKTVELDPTNSLWRKELADILRWMGRSDDYLEQLKLNAYHNPDVAVANENLAGELVRWSRFDEAMPYLRKSYALGTNNYAIEMARVFENLGDNETSVQWVERAKMLFPRRAGFYGNEINRLRGEIEAFVNNLKKRARESTVFMGSHPTRGATVRNFDLRNDLFEEERGRYFARDPLFFESNFVELITADPVQLKSKRSDLESIIALELAAFLLAMDEQEQAERLLDGVLVILERYPHASLWKLGEDFGTPGNTSFLYYKAVYFILRGDNEPALKLLREAVDAGFRNQSCLSDARLDSLREEPEFIELMNIVDTDLREQLANIRRMEANGEFAAIPKLAETLRQEGRFDQYLEQLKLNVSSNPEVAAANGAIGEEFVRRSRFDEAMIYLRKSFALGTHKYANEMRRNFENLGDLETAAQWAERMQALDPSRAKYHGAQVLRHRGEPEMAAKMFKESAPENSVFSGPHSANVFVRNYDFRKGLIQEQIGRYQARDTLPFEPDVLERVQAGELQKSKKHPIAWCVLAMELATFLIADDEQEQADRLLAAAYFLLKENSNPNGWTITGRFCSAPGESIYLYYQAVYHSLLSEKDRALELLREAVDLGFRDRLNLTDARFDWLREEPEYSELMNIVDADMDRQLANIRRMEANGEFATIPKLP
jgi:serine/threonine protein kinase/tetratricopeptide (TPR) repeat protein